MAPSVAVVADDLTSAADGAAPFVERGISAQFFLDALDNVATDASVVAIDTDTRRGRSEDAGPRTARAVEGVRDARVIYKTIDSTLRGHLAEEIDAALSSRLRRHAIVAPAYPARGRTTQAGVQFVDGMLLERTPFARDPDHPAQTSDVRRRLAAIDGVGLVRNAGELAKAWARVRVTVCDAQSDQDLDAIVAAVPPEEVLWVGSPGIAGALARATAGSAATAPSLPTVDRVIVAIGSRNPVTREQLTFLRARSDAIGFGRVAVVATPATTVSCDPLWPLTHEVAALARGAGSLAIVASGGSTARSILEGLETRMVRLLGAFEDGIPVARCPDGIVLITKAGGFGDQSTIHSIVKRLLR